MERDNYSDPIDTVFCLCIDLKKSVEFGMSLPQYKRIIFHKAIYDVPLTEIRKLKLEKDTKFTGDGWLAFCKADKLNALCCLALILAKTLQEEIGRRLKMDKNVIPPLKLAICGGSDHPITWPDGRREWVGDSARRAVRACNRETYLNSVVIDHMVRLSFSGNFSSTKENIPLGKEEESRDLFVLGHINREIVVNSDTPAYFVYTFDKIGYKQDSDIIAHNVSKRYNKDYLSADIEEKKAILQSWNCLIKSSASYHTALDVFNDILNANIKPNIYNYNTLISKAPNPSVGQSWLNKLKAEGIQPDVVTYSTLMNLAQDFNSGREVLQEMKTEGILLNVVTYSTLMNLAQDFNSGREVLQEMKTEGILPNVVTYNTLMNLAQDFNSGREVLQEMKTEGILPNVVTYSTLFKKDLTGISADELLEWYHQQDFHPDTPLQAAISQYRTKKEIKQALRIVLSFPHLQASQKLFRDCSEESLAYFKELFDNDHDNSNAVYGLGLVYWEIGNKNEAKIYLIKAKILSTTIRRNKHIDSILEEIG
ncbi:MAG: hypothetical protein Q8M54_03740 [Desulfobaccales bacterium]|nr:hypothetical protein [Desulfobaccales bacterium]